MSNTYNQDYVLRSRIILKHNNRNNWLSQEPLMSQYWPLRPPQTLHYHLNIQPSIFITRPDVTRSCIQWTPDLCDVDCLTHNYDQLWRLLLGLLSLSPILKSSHCNSFEDWFPVDFIYGNPIFKWVAETWHGREGTRMVTIVLVTKRYTQMNDILLYIAPPEVKLAFYFTMHINWLRLLNLLHHESDAHRPHSQLVLC